MTVTPMSIQPLPSRAEQSQPPFALRQPPVRPARGKLKWIIGGLVLVALIGAGTWLALKHFNKTGAPGAADEKAGSSILTVTTTKVAEQTVSRSMLVTGSLAAWDELPIGTQTSGLAIVDVLVDEGDPVKAGQLLARFDDSVLRADLASREASLHEAEALAAEADANIRRAEDLARTGAISTRDLDARRSTALTTKARVRVAAAARDQAAVRLKQTEVRSPTDGTVSHRNARLGAVMSAGGTELFRIIRDDRVELVAEVPEIDLRSMQVGQPAELSMTDSQGKPFTGNVRLISPVVDVKTRIGTVKIAVPHDPQLRPGMFVSARVTTGTQQAPVVPEAALVYRDARTYVIVASPDAAANGHRKVEAREVDIASRADGRAAVFKGLKAGEEVVLTGAGYLKDGEEVIVTAIPASGDVKPLPVEK
jgi:HlyD family secretion protein